MEARLRLVKRFSLDEVRICAAEICLALKFLHQRKICYRDIKVENILIDAGGHMVLADFGLAVRLEDGKKLRQYCGTSEYMAPGNGYKAIINSNITILTISILNM